MKIAHIGQKGIFVTPRGGGIERHVRELSRRLAESGHEVTVYARRRYTPPRSSDLPGIEIVYLPTFYRKNFEAIIHTFLSTVHAIFQNFDIIHYHGVGPATLSWLPRIFCHRTKVVVTFHSQDQFHQKWGWLARQYLRFGEWAAVRFPHACITVSHVLQIYVRNHFRRQCIYIPNGAEIQPVETDNRVRRLGLLPGGYFLYVGRLVPHKGLQYLIAAYRRLETDKKLVIAGSPSFSERYFRELKRQAAGHSNIIFVGQQEGQALRELYAHCFLYVQPSESEGLSISVLEAMGHGRPVLVSDIPENVEAMHRVGFTFVNKDTDDLVFQMNRLLANPGLLEKVGAEGQRIVQQLYSWSAVTAKIEEVYVTVRH